MHTDIHKVGIVGLGKVGITAAYALLLRHTADEIVLVSRSLEKSEGEKLDLEHGLPFLESVKITASEDYKALEDCDVVIVTAGAAQKPGQSRLDLVEENKKVMDELGSQMKPHVQTSVVVVVSNPVDVLTYRLAQALDLPKGRVFGTGTMLDTARFRFHLSEFLNVNPRSIHAYILGEHGDSSFPAMASATVGGQPLELFPEFSFSQAQEAFAKARDAAAKIIVAKGATYYAIGVVITKVVGTILEDKKSVLPVSTPISDYYGQSGVAVSVPCIVGRNGIEQILKIGFSPEEKLAFEKSCGIIKQYV